MRLPQVDVEFGDQNLKFNSRELEVISRITMGFSNYESVESQDSKTHPNLVNRVATKIRRYTGKKIPNQRALICWFAYAAGLVRL